MFFITHRRTCLSIIAGISIASALAIAVFGIKLSPDFTGGSIVETSFTGAVPERAAIAAELTKLGAESVTVRESGSTALIIRTATLTPEIQTKISAYITGSLKGAILRMNTVGPVIGSELYSKALWAILLVSLSIMMYVAWAFRAVGKVADKKNAHGAGLRDVSSWWYGIIAIITLAHDIIVPAGMIALLGHFYGIEADTLFITAILTILGYSINDTIVIFDRIREKVRSFVGKTQHVPTFTHVVGTAVTETYGRSINTSLTVIISLIALYVFGPESTKIFALAMGLGVVAGTYSSIALAAPLLAIVRERSESSK